MHWDDEGILLSLVPYGERNHIASVFTKTHGRHKGLLSLTKHLQSVISPGAQLKLSWNARLEEHLGRWQIQDALSPMAWIMNNPTALYALQCAVTLSEAILPEREIHPHYFEKLKQLMQEFKNGKWFDIYIHFELSLIQHSGVEFDWSKCAVTGSTDDLAYISPRTGNAVTAQVGQAYRDRLLILPAFLLDETYPGINDVLCAMNLTEYFLKRYSLAIHGLEMPQVRERLKDCLKRQLNMNQHH